jgi:hypothetical protein
MSDAVNFHFIYTQHQPPRAINNRIRKQQPASKLINTYLSTAAQYLNRTKSFHVPSNATFATNKHVPIVNKSQQSVSSNLARSVPSNMNNLIQNPPVSPMTYHEHRFEPVSSPTKSQGFVNTLRRSLRKNKERFYNKRSTTMKSCNSLNNYDQQKLLQTQISMTPTLLCRNHYLEHNNGSSTPITMKNYNSTILINNNNDDEAENNDQMCKKFRKALPTSIRKGRKILINTDIILFFFVCY